MGNYSLPGKTRLKSRKATEQLWAGGQSAGRGAIRARYRLQPIEEKGGPPVLVGFSAPKKLFRRAVQRNRCKRMMRECWRHRQQLLAEAISQYQPGLQLHLFWVYGQIELLPMEEMGKVMEETIRQLIKRWKYEIEKNAGPAPAGTD